MVFFFIPRNTTALLMTMKRRERERDDFDCILGHVAARPKFLQD